MARERKRATLEAANARLLAGLLERASESALKAKAAAEAIPEAKTIAQRQRFEREISKNMYAAVTALEKASALAQRLSDRVSRLTKDA